MVSALKMRYWQLFFEKTKILAHTFFRLYMIPTKIVQNNKWKTEFLIFLTLWCLLQLDRIQMCLKKGHCPKIKLILKIHNSSTHEEVIFTKFHNNWIKISYRMELTYQVRDSLWLQNILSHIVVNFPELETIIYNQSQYSRYRIQVAVLLHSP